MVFCRGCGKEIHESAPTCPKCGAPQHAPSIKNTTSDPIPDCIKGWSWGAFVLGPFWAVSNKTWIGLLAFVPYVGVIMSFILGFKGREWAWKNKEWDSVEHFNNVQKKWSFWGVMLLVVSAVILILAVVAIPAYDNYQHKAQAVAEAKQAEAERVANQAQELEAQHQAEIQAQQNASQSVVSWPPEFKQTEINSCVNKAVETGKPEMADWCKCVMEKASTIIPEQRMLNLNSDTEAGDAFKKLGDSCNG
jgi:Tfp pilus assembly major pilin PilA